MSVYTTYAYFISQKNADESSFVASGNATCTKSGTTWTITFSFPYSYINIQLKNDTKIIFIPHYTT